MGEYRKRSEFGCSLQRKADFLSKRQLKPGTSIEAIILENPTIFKAVTALLKYNYCRLHTKPVALNILN